MVEQKPDQYGFYIHTIVAYRTAVDTAWNLGVFPYEEKDLPEVLAMENIDYVDYKVICNFSTMLGFGEFFFKLHAINHGWMPHFGGTHWSAPDEPVPEPPDESKCSEVEINLDSISYGWLRIAIKAGDEEFLVIIDDVNIMPLVGLTRLTKNIKTGREGHAAVANDWIYIAFQVWPRPDGRSRLRIRNHNRGLEADETVDVLMETNKVVNIFENLINNIALHPNLGHHYICHCVLDADEYDMACELTKEKWNDLVSNGDISDENENIFDDLQCDYIREIVDLNENQKQLVQKYIHMLTTLEIPDDL